tara:strand:+ start:62 stop:544 length:483 start_codon:yes stop_codon:yes gene_type:complete
MLVDDLYKYELFQDLDELGLKKLMQFAKLKRFKKGTEIFKQDQPGAGLFFILDGHIRLLYSEIEDEVEIVDDLYAGDFFGETTLFGDVKDREYTYKAINNVTGLWINTLEYRRLQNSGPAELTKLLLRVIIGLTNSFRVKNSEFGKLKKELEELQAESNE